MRLITLILLVWVCVVRSEWIPKLQIQEKELNDAIKGFDVARSYKTCNTEYTSTGDSRFIQLYKENPMTFVVVGSGEGNIDVKFKDSTYIFEHKFSVSDDKYLVIPPYQPVEWIIVRLGSNYKVCSYSGSVDSSEKGNAAADCECAQAVSSASSFSSVTFPRTIRKPEQQFFLTADITPDPNDVTICTILTVDRLLRLSQMSEMWGGPISAAVYLHDLSEVSKVMEWYLSNNSMRRHIDIHIVVDDKIIPFELPDRAFPVNILRNVAIRFARTANVFYIEGDFIPSPDLYPNLGEVKRRLATGEKTVFIVAPFSTDTANFDMKLFPKDKKALKEVMGKGNLIRDLSYFNSHAAFGFSEWFGSKEIYSMPFAGGYEPYYIGPKSYPLFEEIFVGCGADKVSHPAELNTAGYRFNVLPTGFILHVDSTGMGSAWCRGWAGNARSTMKWEAFTIKTSHIYGRNSHGSFDSRVPWWDLSPIGQKAIASGKEKEGEEDGETCAAPPKEKECPVCPPCKEQQCPVCRECPVAPPSTKQDCDNYKEDLSSVKTKMGKIEDISNGRKAEIEALKDTIRNLRAENAGLVEYSKFVVHLGIGAVVVMAVVVGLGMCIWPRNKKVFVLPTWKSEHHSL